MPHRLFQQTNRPRLASPRLVVQSLGAKSSAERYAWVAWVARLQDVCTVPNEHKVEIEFVCARCCSWSLSACWCRESGMTEVRKRAFKAKRSKRTEGFPLPSLVVASSQMSPQVVVMFAHQNAATRPECSEDEQSGLPKCREEREAASRWWRKIHEVSSNEWWVPKIRSLTPRTGSFGIRIRFSAHRAW